MREVLIGYKAGTIKLGDAVRKLKELTYGKRDDFRYEGKIRNIIDNKIMRERGEV